MASDAEPVAVAAVVDDVDVSSPSAARTAVAFCEFRRPFECAFRRRHQGLRGGVCQPQLERTAERCRRVDIASGGELCLAEMLHQHWLVSCVAVICRKPLIALDRLIVLAFVSQEIGLQCLPPPGRRIGESKGLDLPSGHNEVAGPQRLNRRGGRITIEPSAQVIDVVDTGTQRVAATLVTRSTRPPGNVFADSHVAARTVASRASLSRTASQTADALRSRRAS